MCCIIFRTEYISGIYYQYQYKFSESPYWWLATVQLRFRKKLSNGTQRHWTAGCKECPLLRTTILLRIPFIWRGGNLDISRTWHSSSSTSLLRKQFRVKNSSEQIRQSRAASDIPLLSRDTNRHVLPSPPEPKRHRVFLFAAHICCT